MQVIDNQGARFFVWVILPHTKKLKPCEQEDYKITLHRPSAPQVHPWRSLVPQRDGGGRLYRYDSPKAPIYIIDPADIPVHDSRIIHILSRLSATAEAEMKRSGIGRPGGAGVIRGHRNGGFLGDGVIIE